MAVETRKSLRRSRSNRMIGGQLDGYLLKPIGLVLALIGLLILVDATRMALRRQPFIKGGRGRTGRVVHCGRSCGGRTAWLKRRARGLGLGRVFRSRAPALINTGASAPD